MIELIRAWIISGLQGLDLFVLAYFILIGVVYSTLVLSATWDVIIHMFTIRGENQQRVLGSAVSPRISILAPAYNEQATIAESVTALLALHYPNLEVVVINDGSPDRTMDVLKERFDLVPIHTIVWKRVETKPVKTLYRSRSHPNLVVADKVNGRKADAINVGLNVAAGELVCVIDADTIVESDALLRLARPYLSEPNVLAAGGTIRIANGSDISGGRVTHARAPRTFIAGVQVVEYLRAYFFGRLGWNRLGGNLVISGAFGLFKRDSVIAVGGYTHDTVGEDLEIVVKLRRLAYERGEKHHVAFVPDAVAWTEAPESLQILGNQRDRWHRGLSDVLWRHRRAMLNPRYGAMGLIGLPYLFLIELIAPLVEIIGWGGLALGLVAGAVNWTFALALFLVAYGMGAVFSTYALFVDEVTFPRYTSFVDRLRLMGYLVLETFGYRQLTTWWRLRGLIKFVRGQSTEWGRMERKGFAASQNVKPVAPAVTPSTP